MPVITIQELVAKNKAGKGIRNSDHGDNRANNAAALKLAELIKKAGPIVSEDNDALQLSCDFYADALKTLATTTVNSNTRGKVGKALSNLNGFDESLRHMDSATKQTFYDAVVKALPSMGSSKEEFDTLLRTVSGVLELGLENSLLKPVDPKEAERRRQEEERRRQEAERRRQEEERRRQEEARLRQERERQRREAEQRRQEEERRRQEEENRRREAERLQREAEKQRQEAERKRREDRVKEIREKQDAFLKEDYIGTDYEDKDVQPLKLDTERYNAHLETERVAAEVKGVIEEADRVAKNPNILDGEKEKVEEERQQAADKIKRAEEKERQLNDPLLNRKRDKEDIELLAEEEAKNEKPLPQKSAVMISQSLRDSFLKRYPDSKNKELTATDIDGRKFVGTDAILEALSDEDTQPKLYIDIPGDPEHRSICLQGEDGRLLISKGPVYRINPDIDLEPADLSGLEADFTRFCSEKGIESAVGTDGTVYTKKEDMFRALDAQDRLMLFGKDKEFAYGVLKQGDTLHATGKAYQQKMGSESVSPDRLPEKTTLFGLKDQDILYAVTEEGTRLGSVEDIRKEVKTGKGLLRVHTARDKDNPYVIDYERGLAAITKYPVYEGQIEKLTQADYLACVPEEIEEKYILNWKEDEISHAVDADGKRYNTPQEIKTALYGEDKTLQLYTKPKKGENAKEHELPFAVEKRNNRFYISRERVLKFEDQMGQLGETLAGMEEDDFAQVYMRGNAAEFLQKNYTEGTSLEIDFALDDKGNLYDSAEKIAEELDKSEGKTLFIFDKSGELPYAVRKKEGEYYKSSDRIGTQSILPETLSFKPKKSLDPDVLGDRTDATAYWDYNTQKDRAGELLKYYQGEVTRLSKLKKQIPSKPPKEPVKPKLGGWNTFVRRLKKIVTFGRGEETAAYQKYLQAKKKYQADMKSFPERKKNYENREETARLFAEAEAGVSKAEKKLATIKAELDKASAGLDADHAEHSKQSVVAYRKRTEARLEGVLDLKATGRITPENIFAHTWLKEAECRGKPASDPEARKALCAYIASDAVQNDLLNNRFKGKDKTAKTSKALDERMINQLNTGKAVEALMKDEDLKKLLDGMGSKPIDPSRVKNKFIEVAAAKKYQDSQEVNIYTMARTAMEKDFGEQELSEQALDEVIRYKKLQRAIDARYIKVYDSAPKGLATIFGTKPTEADKAPFREAFNSLRSQGKGPMGLRQMTDSLDNRKRELEQEELNSEQLSSSGPQL